MKHQNIEIKNAGVGYSGIFISASIFRDVNHLCDRLEILEFSEFKS